MLGPELARCCRVVNHDARNPSVLARVGTTTTGVPVYLNREWVDADFRITTGFVEPHFFAGFSGGPKMVAPGLAGLETVMALHDARRIGHPRATWGITDGNPVHDDVREIARMVRVDFAVDVTLNREQKITAAFAGEILAEHGRACAYAKDTAMRAVPAPFDVVLTTNSGYPLDQNLYQAVKGMSAAAQIVSAGGFIAAAARCNDGFPAHGNFKQLLFDHDSPRAILDTIEAPGFSLYDQWEAQILALVRLRARVGLYSDIPADDVRRAHLEPLDDIGRAVADERRRVGEDAPVAVLPEGPMTIPYLR
jgi:nickel-dependent lactate racemase